MVNIDADRFWDFTVDHYRSDDVSRACMELQDRYGGNVNFALLMLYLDQVPFDLGGRNLAVLKTSLQRSDPVLTSFRELRLDLKRAVAADVYQRMLDFELGLERQQQRDLLDALRRIRSQPRKAGSAFSNLYRYCDHLGASHLTSAIRGENPP